MRKTESDRIMTIVKKDIVKDITVEFNGKYTEKEVEDILNSFWDVCTYYLYNATKKQSVLLKPFFGLQLSSKIIDERAKKLNGEEFIQSSRKKATAKLTRYYNRCKMNNFK